MSKMFYHVMQDNVGNLLFDVSGTFRIAGTGTLATIYGDEALTVILPNPMTNHPSFASFKCFLGVGDYDFYLAKSGYTFETLTGVQGSGSMADQDANAVVITGGYAEFTATPESLRLADNVSATHIGLRGTVSFGSNKYNLYCDGTAGNFFGGHMVLAPAPEAPNGKLTIRFPKASLNGIILRPTDSDTGTNPLQFQSLGNSPIGSIATSSTTTTYNTTSDARLKEHVEDLPDALAVVQALRPVQFRWKADGSPGHGFLASEVQAVIPEGVITGDEGAVDEEGKIQPQMIDYSKLVPWLTAALKEAVERIDVLTARLDAAGA